MCNVYSLSGPNVDTNSIVIDSGESSSVCSTESINKVSPALLSKLDHGSRKFRFGDSRSFESVGTVLMRGTLPITMRCKRMVREAAMQLDVINAQIPILLPRRTLPLMGEVINFTNCSLRLGNGDLIQLDEQKSGRMSLALDISPFQSTGGNLIGEATIFAAEAVSLTRSEIEKLHRHTGHADASILRQMIQNAGRIFGPDAIHEVIKNCPCVNSRARISPNIANRYLSHYPGFSAFLDIWYPKEGSGRKFPHLAVIDAVSRFLICVPIVSLAPTVAISSFGRN